MTPDVTPSPFNFDDIPIPGEIRESATLAAMLAEGREITSRGMTFVVIPPTIRELERIFPLLNHMQGKIGTEEAMRASVELARRLLRVKKSDGALRCATAIEIEDRFTLPGVSRVIQETLSDQGFERDAEKN